MRILAEYELILYAARNDSLGREYRAWQRGLDAQLVVALEDAGAPRPLEAASIVSSLTRAFELECITDPSKPAEESPFRPNGTLRRRSRQLSWRGS